VKRFKSNPILTPIASHPWEAKLVYNSAAFKIETRTYLLYRALGADHISRLGLAWAQDGTRFENRLPHPVFEPRVGYELPSEETRASRNREKGGCEDPRATIIGDTLYITYTAYGELCQIALASMAVAKFKALVNSPATRQAWNQAWTRHGLAFPQLPAQGVFSRNACVFSVRDNVYGLIYRFGKEAMEITYSSSPLGPWPRGETLMQPKQPWERERMGICTPPIETPHGQLFVYHGVESTPQEGRTYRLGCFFARFSQDQNGKISHSISRASQPILSPEREYERKSAWLEPLNVYAVFSCGAVPAANNSVCEDDDEIIIYYSGGDSRLCAATAKVSELAQLAGALKGKLNA